MPVATATDPGVTVHHDGIRPHSSLPEGVSVKQLARYGAAQTHVSETANLSTSQGLPQQFQHHQLKPETYQNARRAVSNFHQAYRSRTAELSYSFPTVDLAAFAQEQVQKAISPVLCNQRATPKTVAPQRKHISQRQNAAPYPAMLPRSMTMSPVPQSLPVGGALRRFNSEPVYGCPPVLQRPSAMPKVDSSFGPCMPKEPDLSALHFSAPTVQKIVEQYKSPLGQISQQMQIDESLANAASPVSVPTIPSTPSATGEEIDREMSVSDDFVLLEPSEESIPPSPGIEELEWGSFEPLMQIHFCKNSRLAQDVIYVLSDVK
eukprot:Colp12_sorted_trinity150504_noHs@10345